MKSENSTNVMPIAPDKVEELRPAVIPDEVIESFNELILENWDGRKSHFKQKDVTKRIRKKNKKLTNKILFDKHYLDVESIYISNGWKVEYGSPDRDESFEEYFVFSKEDKK